MPTKKKYTYKQKTSKKKQYNKKKRTIKKRHTRKKTRYGGSFLKLLSDRRKKRILKKLMNSGDIKSFESDLKKINGLETDKDFMIKAIRINQKAWEHADETLKNNRDFTLKAINENTSVLNYIHTDDDEIVTAAVTKQGTALMYATKEMKNNKDVVTAAVKNEGTALEHANEDMKNNEDVVTAAVKNNGISIAFASVKLLKNDKYLVKLLNLYWKGAIKYPHHTSSEFRLDNDKNPIYKGKIDKNFDLFFLYIDYLNDGNGEKILEDERKNYLIECAQKEIKEEAGRNLSNNNNHNRNNEVTGNVTNPLADKAGSEDSNKNHNNNPNYGVMNPMHNK